MPRPKKEKPNHAGGLYEVKITVGKTLDGKLQRKSFYSSISKEDARKQAEEWKVQREVSNRTGSIFVEKDVTFASWVEKWAETYKRPDVTERTYLTTYISPLRNHLIPYFSNALLADIKPIDIKNFFNEKSNLSESTLDKLHMILNAAFEAAIDNNLCAKNPARKIFYSSNAQKNLKKVYTDEQIEIVELFAAERMPEVVILIETGMRRGELLGVMWSDIDFENKTFSVNRSIIDQSGGGVTIGSPKHGSYRTNPLSPRALEVLTRLPRMETYIFPGHNGFPQSPNSWARKLSRFMHTLSSEHPEIPKLTAHELRHTCGTRLRRRGVDIYTIEKFMGHKDINVTAGTYVHNEIATLHDALKSSFEPPNLYDTFTT